MTVLQDPSAPSDPADPHSDPPDHERDGLLARIGRAAGRRPRRVLALLAIVVLLAGPLAVTLTGALSDRWGRRRVYRIGSVFLLLYSFPAWWMLTLGNHALAIAVIAVASMLVLGAGTLSS